jgi:hypothetical protein
VLLAVCLSSFVLPLGADDLMRTQIEADWLRQLERWASGGPAVPKTRQDAAGAVDGVKDGKYAFHTGLEPNPWWQVDLGQPQAIARIVVFNRLDYAPGLHNADHLGILGSDDGVQWTVLHENRGTHFGGVSGAAPLDVPFPQPPEARYIRLQVRSDQPIFFHLDEVEIFGADDPHRNIALGCTADQSSISQWSTNKLVADTRTALPIYTAQLIRQGVGLAHELQQHEIDTQDALRELEVLQQRLGQLDQAAAEESWRQLYFDVRWTIRRLVWRHPLLNFDHLLFVKRFTQQAYPDICLNHMPWVSPPGGDICTLMLGGPEDAPQVRPILQGALGPGHVHGIDLHWDGQRVVFGYAQAKSDQPPAGWLDRTTSYHLRRTEEPIHLFEVYVDGTGLRQLTEGEWSDLDPTYAPNEDIVFVSERCGCSLQCNEFDKDETSCNLYVMHSDGSNIRRMSASKDGDYLPHCLDDGTIGYCRWEYQERGWANIQSIWTVRPDGTGADALFKQHLNDPWALEDVRSIPGCGTRKLVAIAAGHHTLATGPIVVVTPAVGINDARGIRIVTPDSLPPEGGMSGTPVDEGGVRDGGGLYSTPWALSERLFLTAYSFSNEQTELKGYALYVVDVHGNKELIYRDPDISCFSPIPLRPRTRPPVINDTTDATARYATLLVANAAHGVDGVDPRAARYLRISQRLVWPYNNQDGGHRYHEVPHTQQHVPNWTPARVLGEVPLEADGSAYFRVPADTAVYFQLLDENHMELRRMRAFISLQPGEQRMCFGCHETRGEAPVAPVFPLAAQREPTMLQPPAWGERAVNFLRDIQPIFDRYCTTCHSGLQPAADLDFSGGLTARGVIPAFGSNRAYETIRVHQLVSRSNVRGDASITQPLEFGSHRSKLVEVLRQGPCGRRAHLSDEEFRVLVTWIDANSPYHSTFINKRAQEPAYDLPADRELLDKVTSIHARRCQACHEAADITRPHWIDIRSPRQSLLLTAPLAVSAGGLQRCGQPTYATCDDPDYQAVLQLLEDAVWRAWKYPRRDVQALLER